MFFVRLAKTITRGGRGVTIHLQLQHHFLLKILFNVKREGMGGRKRGRNIHQLLVIPLMRTELAAHMCPDQESNWQPFALWDDAQPTEPHWSGFTVTLFWVNKPTVIIITWVSFSIQTTVKVLLPTPAYVLVFCRILVTSLSVPRDEKKIENHYSTVCPSMRWLWSCQKPKACTNKVTLKDSRTKTQTTNSGNWKIMKGKWVNR